jgi:hypothetical protein
MCEVLYRGMRLGYGGFKIRLKLVFITDSSVWLDFLTCRARSVLQLWENYWVKF